MPVARLTLSVAVVLLVVLAGCGGGGGEIAPSIQTTSVTMSVDWPVATQAILPAVKRIVITVTGAGIDPPVEAVIVRPATSVTFEVPSGTNRQFRVVGKDEAGNEVQLREVAVQNLVANDTVELTVELYDVHDPADDTQAHATTVVPDGRTYCNRVLDHQSATDPDTVDWYRLEAQANHVYEIETVDVVSNIGHAVAVYSGDHQLLLDDAGPNGRVSLRLEPANAGVYYIKVFIGTHPGHVLYCLKVTGGAKPAGTDVVLRVR